MITQPNMPPALLQCIKDLEQQPFPFKTTLSLAPLLEFWLADKSSSNPTRAAVARLVERELSAVPELLQPLTAPADHALLEKHHSLISALMTVAFPPATFETDYAAAFAPFGKIPFYTTPMFLKSFSTHNFLSNKQLNIDESLMTYGKMLNAYLQIARAYYDIDIAFDYPIIVGLTHPETKLMRYFNLQMNPRFIRVKPVGDLPVLTPEMRDELLRHLSDLNMWMKLLPPDRFEFSGFTVINGIDVTNQEVLSAMKRDLIDKTSIVSRESFSGLQDKIRSLLMKPDLTLSLSAFDGDDAYLLNSGMEDCTTAACFSQQRRQRLCQFTDTIFGEAVRSGRILAIEDLEHHEPRTALEEQLLASGIRSVVIAPLSYQDAPIGMLKISSPNAGDLNEINTLKLREVLPLFSMAVRRTTEEMNTNIQAVIKEKFTVIHPAIDWRFRKAAVNYLQAQNDGLNAEIEDIVFRDVYPLYGVSDVRNSSTQRNLAIQEDLIEHLTMAREVLMIACTYKPLPVLEELIYRVGQKIEHLRVRGLSSGDEATTIEFLRRDVESHFSHLSEFHEEVQKHVAAYTASIDPHLGMLYKRRKAFEESVMKLNDTLGAYIDDEEAKAQAMFPHYFEKHKSDGIDYSIYIGASLVENGKFDMLYLRNLRLWQLMMMAGAAERAERLKPTLPVPLDTAHLLLVQTSPLSVRFRVDEKTLDVDGAYNVRYEIMKKRIDKAEVKGTSERITQPGKIAIIYSQPKEIFEYRDAIAYLQAKGILAATIEELELEDLHGVQGLRALRVTVNVGAEPQTDSIMKMVAQAMQQAA